LSAVEEDTVSTETHPGTMVDPLGRAVVVLGDEPAGLSNPPLMMTDCDLAGSPVNKVTAAIASIRVLGFMNWIGRKDFDSRSLSFGEITFTAYCAVLSTSAIRHDGACASRARYSVN
jgi:hypothetical protein